jgi:hypothetical protein
MKLLESKKFPLPEVFLVTNRAEIKEIPVGVPFIYADKKDETALIRLLEYEVLFTSAKRTGFPFNFAKILKDNGYLDLQQFEFSHPVYMDYATEDNYEEGYAFESSKKLEKSSCTKFKDYVRDNAAYVDLEKLKDLNVFPIWLDTIEKAIHTNIHNFAVFNNNMYNKKLEGMYGAIDLVPPHRNLIVIDISGSIPKAVSSTCLTMAKNLSETFYADLLITGSKSTLYLYEELYKLDISTIYEENGTDNDQQFFKDLLVNEKKIYRTAIVFGDNHSPCYSWNNEYNKNTTNISKEKGKEISQWEVEKVVSFHTSNKNKGDTFLAGYADWFEPKETEHILNWVKYLKD